MRALGRQTLKSVEFPHRVRLPGAAVWSREQLEAAVELLEEMGVAVLLMAVAVEVELAAKTAGSKASRTAREGAHAAELALSSKAPTAMLRAFIPLLKVWGRWRREEKRCWPHQLFPSPESRRHLGSEMTTLSAWARR